jgi:uncharacterized membrane protein YphA (DoxX/SURF4 family)
VQNPLRVTARILTGTTYVVLGYAAFRDPGKRVATAASTLATLRKAVPLPDDDALLVRANAAVQVGAGALMVTGALQRPAAAVLVGSLVPTTFAGHDFWNVEDPAARTAQRTQFLKNLTMIGGLLFAVLDKPRSRA